MKTTEKTYKVIGLKIKEAREAAGMSQKELADKLGFESATAISLIESGERRISIDYLEKISGILHKDIKFFLGQEERIDFEYALRADNELTKKDKDDILRFIDFVRKK